MSEREEPLPRQGEARAVRTADAAGIELRAIRPGDATGLVRCVRRCYGDGYPNEDYYDAARLRARIESGEHGGVVARDGDALIGHIAIRPASGGPGVVETGTTIVDPDHRGRGVMSALAGELVAECLRRGAAGFVHFPTTAHAVMQRASLVAGGRETGILLAYIPAQTADRTLERAATGRLAVTVVYQPLAAAPPQEMFVPERYEGLITSLAAELRLTRRRLRPGAPGTGPTALARSTDDARSLERVVVDRVGADVGEVGRRLASLASDLVHIDLPMSDPAIEHATGALLDAGFVYGAWLPGWAGADVLRLQRVRDPLGAPPPLASPAAAALLRLIHADAAAAHGTRP